MKIARALLALAFPVVVVCSRNANAQSCTPPRVLFVIDASSSMNDTIPDGGTTVVKWEALRAAIDQVLSAWGNNAEFGLMVFPGSSGQCAAGEILVDVGAGTASIITSTIAGYSVPSSGDTPAGQTLATAAGYGLITDPAYANHVVFLTDGYQYCNIGDTACVTASDCALMGVAPCPTCLPDFSEAAIAFRTGFRWEPMLSRPKASRPTSLASAR